MKKDLKNSKTTKIESNEHYSNPIQVFAQENITNTSNTINDIQDNDYKELDNLISNRIDQYNSENINLLLMLNRAYYMNELEKIERYLNTLDYLNGKSISKVDEKRLILCFNRLSKLEYLYIYLEDYYKSLQLQKRIINFVKKYFIDL